METSNVFDYYITLSITAMAYPSYDPDEDIHDLDHDDCDYLHFDEDDYDYSEIDMNDVRDFDDLDEDMYKQLIPEDDWEDDDFEFLTEEERAENLKEAAAVIKEQNEAFRSSKSTFFAKPTALSIEGTKALANRTGEYFRSKKLEIWKIDDPLKIIVQAP